MVNNKLHIFIKFNEENVDFPKVKTMSEHVKVMLENGEFCWGHFTKTKDSRNKKGLWEMRTEILDSQLNAQIPTLVFFYSRTSGDLYVGKLEGYYDREYPDTHPEIKKFIPEYYHSRIGAIQKGMGNQMRSYAFVRVSNLKKINFEDTQYIYNYKGKDETIGEENVLECKGMASLLYINLEDNFYNGIKKKLIVGQDKSKLQIVDDESSDSEYKIGKLNKESNVPNSIQLNRKKHTETGTSNKLRGNKDYEKSQKKNKKVGDVGELLVLEKEKSRLIEMQRADLAQDIIHVSKEQGDGMGYDILSYEVIDGEVKEKYIEVKTTEYGINTPFMIEENEVNFSRNNSDNYYIYRVYNYDKKTGNAEYYIKQGNVEENFKLTNKTYAVYFRNGK